jgi:sarcosine oxidase subunit gamma
MAETRQRRCLELGAANGEGTRGMVTDAVVIRLQPPCARFSLRIDPSLLPSTNEVAGFMLHTPINRGTSGANRAAMRLGPDEWLLSGREGESAAIAFDLAAALADLNHSLVDVGHQYVSLAVSGPRAADAINCGCPLDLRLVSFPPGCAVRTLLAKAEIILSCQDDTPVYEIQCARSYAAYVRDFLSHAARQYSAPT